jgi:hypothetical protein
MKYFDVTAHPEIQRLPVLRKKTGVGDLPSVVESTSRLVSLLTQAAIGSGNEFLMLAVTCRGPGLVSLSEEAHSPESTAKLRAALDELVRATLHPEIDAHRKSIEEVGAGLGCRCLGYLEQALADKARSADSLCCACVQGDICRCTKFSNSGKNSDEAAFSGLQAVSAPSCFEKATLDLIGCLS